MKTLNYISKSLRKLLAFPFKLVGNVFMALGLTMSIGINGILFPEDLTTMESILTVLMGIKDEVEKQEA